MADDKDYDDLRNLAGRNREIRNRYGSKRPLSTGPITVRDVMFEERSLRGTEESGKARSYPGKTFELIDEALSEKAPTAGGSYEGSVYYSNILPKGEDKTPWSKAGSNLVTKAAQPNAKKSDILAVQNYFVDIGYMHHSEVDAMKGKQLMGMIRRWSLNAGTSKESMFDAMKTWKDNLFDGGSDEYEEDLREGGGDQGGY
tara:strand:- start:3930 stop:4529 length:600 start_codon:yes stop_codon:yes gene_type:complete